MAISKEEREKRAVRLRQAKQLNDALPDLERAAEKLTRILSELNLLDSVSLGLYEEIDKLAKKAAVDQVTDLVLDHVNDVIREAKALASADPFVQRLGEFVAAGDNPEHRDVVLVLRQLRQGLERFRLQSKASLSRIQSLLKDAQGIKVAIDFSLQGDEPVTEESLEYNSVSVSSEWLTGLLRHFHFDKLDRTDIPSHFASQQ